MSIQFNCPRCQQPIEIDDDWGGQSVGCPYCRNVVSSPRQSTLGLADVPMASPLTPIGLTAAGPATAAAARKKNPYALWGLVCSCVSMLCYVIASIIAGVHVLDAIGERPDANQFKELMAQRLQSALQAGESWVVIFAVLMLFTIVLWFAGAVLSGLAIAAGPRGRGMAIAGCAVCGLMLILVCSGLFV